jgi:hypothetical protein
MNETNPELGEKIIEVVQNQIQANDPPETKQTYERLLTEGHSDNEALRLIACALSSEMFQMMKEKKTFSEERFIKMLNALPQKNENRRKKWMK